MQTGFYLISVFLFLAISSCHTLPLRAHATKFHFVGRLRGEASSGDRNWSSGDSAQSGSGTESECPDDDEDCGTDSSGGESGSGESFQSGRKSNCPYDDEECETESSGGESSGDEFSDSSGSGCPEDDEDCARTSGKSPVNNGCGSTVDDEDCITSGSGSGAGEGASGDDENGN